jgi:hypothetical protein
MRPPLILVGTDTCDWDFDLALTLGFGFACLVIMTHLCGYSVPLVKATGYYQVATGVPTQVRCWSTKWLVVMEAPTERRCLSFGGPKNQIRLLVIIARKIEL